MKAYHAANNDAIPAKLINFVKNDGGRAAASYKGTAGDCVCRAICITTGLPYAQVYDRLAQGCADQRATKRNPKRSRSARNGINTDRKWFKDYMAELGFFWVPLMGIGTGCKVHLRADELPRGRLIVSLSGHMAAVIDKVLHDTYDCSRDGTRCVYGIWVFM